MLRIALIWVVCLAVASGTASAVSIVTNGGFEPGNLSGWTASGTGAVNATGAQGKTEGSYAAAFNGGDNGNPITLYQDLATVIGAVYQLDFDFGVYGVSVPQSLNVKVVSDPAGTPATLVDQTPSDTGSNPTTFSHYTYSFTAAASTTRLQFFSSGANTSSADSMLDAVAVNATSMPVAEPGLGLLSLGSLGAVLLSRRKRARGAGR